MAGRQNPPEANGIHEPNCFRGFFYDIVFGKIVLIKLVYARKGGVLNGD